MSIEFKNLAEYYDLMYVDEKHFKKQAEQAHALAGRYGVPEGGRMLELACATGMYSRYLSEYYDMTGTEMSESMIQKARQNAPRANFMVKDSLNFQFDFSERFDAAVNFYGAIGLVKGWDNMRRLLEGVWDNLKPGGMFLFTPWCIKETQKDEIISLCGQKEGERWHRLETRTRVAEDTIALEMHHLVARENDVKYHHYTIEYSFWSHEEHLRAIEKSGFRLEEFLDETEFPRGAYICIKEGL